LSEVWRCLPDGGAVRGTADQVPAAPLCPSVEMSYPANVSQPFHLPWLPQVPQVGE
jgi:hypothetical protein